MISELENSRQELVPEIIFCCVIDINSTVKSWNIPKATVGNEAASEEMGQPLGACMQFTSCKALHFHSDCVAHFKRLLVSMLCFITLQGRQMDRWGEGGLAASHVRSTDVRDLLRARDKLFPCGHFLFFFPIPCPSFSLIWWIRHLVLYTLLSSSSHEYCSNVFPSTGQQTPHKDSEEHSEPSVEWDPGVSRNHSGWHDHQNSQVGSGLETSLACNRWR